MKSRKDLKFNSTYNENMYKIKQIPEDFVVKEIPNYEIKEKGNYPIYLLIKTNITTQDAINKVADHFDIKPKFIGYAGIKDKKAITEQYISINLLRKKLSPYTDKSISLEFQGFNDEPIYIGRLIENKFAITIRNLKIDKIKPIKKMPNKFGTQRFSAHNVDIGRFIIKHDFKMAVDFILKNKGTYERDVSQYLAKHPNDFIGAMRLIPLKIRKLYIHAYQSELFNEAVDSYVKESSKNIKIPLIGFGTESSDIYRGIMAREEITTRDFIIRGMQELSSEGAERNAFVTIKNFKVISKGNDELNKGKKKIIVSFSLPKGSYATEAIDYLIQNNQDPA
jgi:tRNA pseudouridine13 synthase